MYKVSLAIPIYNVSLFVERALLSVLNQTYDNIEYLIVDDKGQDDSMDIVHRIIKDHPRGKDVRIIEHRIILALGLQEILPSIMRKASICFLWIVTMRSSLHA